MTHPPDRFVDQRYAKSKRYAQDLAEINRAGVCPFCPGKIQWHPKPILERDGGWFITENAHPYPNSERHYLIIGDEHKEELDELTATDLSSILALAKTVTCNRAKGGALALRFGSTSHTGATVKHLHAHIIIPQTDPETQQALPVVFPIG